MFKVGDKVRRKSDRRNIEAYKNYGDGDPWTIETILHGYIHDPNGKKHSSENLELVETHFPLYSEEAAVKLLTERGYEVKAPPEPLKGKVVIYRNRQDEIWTISKEQWDQRRLKTRQTCTVIAIVDWVEGQGT